MREVILVLSCIAAFAIMTEGKGYVSVRLTSMISDAPPLPTGKSNVTICLKFTIWTMNEFPDIFKPCKSFVALLNRGTMHFGDHIGETPNPITIYFDTVWPEEGDLEMTVEDLNSGQVDTFHKPITRSRTGEFLRSAELDFTADIDVGCQVGYYGRECIVECETPRGDAHYVCDRDTGNKNCHGGWEGEICETNIDDCERGPCQNGGHCQDKVDDFTCVCPEAYRGFLCQQQVYKCLDDTNCRHGICTDHHPDYTCDCKPGWTGPKCDVIIDLCASEPCLNGALKCDNSYAGEIYCTCAYGFEGAFCEEETQEFHKVIDPACTFLGMCLHGGTCFQVEGKDFDNSYFCECEEGWGGVACHEDIDECQLNICADVDTCENTEGNFTCGQCPNVKTIWGADYLKGKCERKIDYCQPNPCTQGSTCQSLRSGFRCHCEAGWTGKLCERDVDECAGYPKVHRKYPHQWPSQCNDRVQTGSEAKSHFRCVNTSPGFKCECDLGWMGDYCSIDVSTITTTTTTTTTTTAPTSTSASTARTNATTAIYSPIHSGDDEASKVSSAMIIMLFLVGLLLTVFSVVFWKLRHKECIRKHYPKGSTTPEEGHVSGRGTGQEAGHVVKGGGLSKSTDNASNLPLMEFTKPTSFWAVESA